MPRVRSGRNYFEILNYVIFLTSTLFEHYNGLLLYHVRLSLLDQTPPSVIHVVFFFSPMREVEIVHLPKTFFERCVRNLTCKECDLRNLLSSRLPLDSLMSTRRESGLDFSGSSGIPHFRSTRS